MNMALTIDGKSVRPEGRWFGLSSVNDRQRMDKIRSRAQAVVTGSGTIIKDNPVLWLRRQDGTPDPDSPLPVIMCRSSLPPQNAKVFRGVRKPLLFANEKLFSDGRFRNEQEFCRQAADPVLQSEDAVTPENLLCHLSAKGITQVLLEGGPVLTYSFLEEDLIDRIYITIVPFIIGMKDLGGLADGQNPLTGFDTAKWKPAESEIVGNEIFLIWDRIH